MDERLKTTARSGDIVALYTLIHDNPNVFKPIDDMEFVDTPLHEAAVSGNTGLAMEIMNLKPSYARKLNQDGFSPIHLALLKNQTDMVTEFVSVDKDLIRVKGRDGFTVLHLLASYGTGNVQLLSRFLELCPDCIFDLTTRRQTALHIAAENNRFEAMEAMVKWIERQEKDNNRVLRSKILNSQDKDGNTALHLAAENNQTQMIKLLINCTETDRNKTNLHGYTASDVLQRQIVGDHSESLRLLNTNPSPSGFETKMSMFETRLVDYFRALKPETISALLVVLQLVQTMTYQAILSPLGGVSQGGAGGSNNNEVNPGVSQGGAGGSTSNNGEVKSELHWYLFLCFYLPNGIAFVMSSVITMMMYSVVVESIMPFLWPLYVLTLCCYFVAILILAPSYAVGAVATLGVVLIVTVFYWIRGNRMMKRKTS